jgi:diacylglycerol kinase (ATP)
MIENTTNSNDNLDLDLTTKYIIQDIQNSMIIFCNPLSGNQEGKIILDIASKFKTQDGYKLMDFQYINSNNKYEPIKAIFFELINKEDNAKGQLILKHCVERCKKNKENGLPENCQKIKILIGSGDGTVVSMIESFIRFGSDINYCLFAHLPLGTGNDLANTLGFSDHINISNNNINDLYNILNRYYKANFGKIDIWKIDLQLDNNEGHILANTKNGKIILKDNNGNIIKRYVRNFINYISLGYDARVGYNFDPRRTKSRNGNKCIYFYEGLKKIFCRKTITVQGIIDTLTIYDSENNSVNQDAFFSDIETNNVKTEEKMNKIKFQFISKKTYEKIKKNNKKCLVIQGEPCSIIFQNVVNFMSGVTDMWVNGKDHLAIKVKNTDKENENKYIKKLTNMAVEKQKYDDKQLEIFTFDNGACFGFEKMIGGLIKKIYHGRGPIEIKFLETPNYMESDKKNRIYFNLDGEYFHIVKPILLKIEINRDLCNGQLPFLIGNP